MTPLALCAMITCERRQFKTEFLEAFFFAATAFITAVLFDSLLFFFYIIMHSLNISRSPLAQEWILAIRKFPNIACDLLLPDLGTVLNEPRD